MDKSLLVVVLCLQVFLLITAFTSTDAAALVTDDQQQQSPDLVEAMRLPKRKIRRVSSSACSLRPGACIGFRREPPTKPPIKKNKENAKDEGIKTLQRYLGFLCSLRPGACSLLGRVKPQNDLKVEVKSSVQKKMEEARAEK